MFYRFLYLGFKIYCFLFRPIRVGVRAMMVENESVWLVRHTYLPGWFMPGGGVKKWETLDEAARREAHEETGAELGKVDLMGVYTSYIQWKTDHTSVFLCKDFKFTGESDAEIAEMRLFHLNALPEDTYSLHRNLLEKYGQGKILPRFGEW
ncbi:MAG TPA: NUDIX domain-containing protein [Anaerolineales bacterium]|nr:NUDIX domain-containing protein [Anaerolineales bacterium]HNN14644.1 NUDIX domain-containing protein [Anaerolineales bacterium]HNO93518.1 NUDIX domain-containing protein [Anaerolineales bacterium]